MKEKLKLNRVILGGLLLGSLSTFSVPLVRTEQVCPIGGERFEDLDVPQCPTNKFVMFKKKFTAEELEKYEKIISSKEYTYLPRKQENYFFLRFNNTDLESSSFIIMANDISISYEKKYFNL